MVIAGMISKRLAKNRTNLLYGALLGILVFLLNWLELRFLIFEHSIEIYIGPSPLFLPVSVSGCDEAYKPKIQTVIVENIFTPIRQRILS